MALTNLGELKASVADWLNREDLTTQIPDFVKLAENRINADHRSRVVANEVHQAFTVASENQINPVAQHSPFEVTAVVVDGKVIQNVTWDEYHREQDSPKSANGVYTFSKGNLYYSGFVEESGTAPDPGGADVVVEYHGFELSEFNFTSDASTTALFTEHPEIFLYASLLEASVYLRDMEGVQIYQVRYDELMDKIQKSFNRRKVSGGFTVSSVGGDFNFDRSY